MGHRDLGDEMNLSLIHSISCAKYSIIKVTHRLYDPTFPDISSFERSHTLSVIFFFFQIWIFFLLKHRNLSFTKWPSPWRFLIISLRNAYAAHKSAVWLPGARQLGCLLEFWAWPQSWQCQCCYKTVSLKTTHAASHRKFISHTAKGIYQLP